MRGHNFAIVLLVCAASVSCQTSKNSTRPPEVISIPSIGLRYTPPAGMSEKTTAASKQFRDHASTYSAKAAQLVLDMSSGDDDSSPAWHQVWMFIFPRAQLSTMDDASAEAKMNTALAGPVAAPAGQPQNSVLRGRAFLVSEFELKEPPLTKHAEIFTTVCKTQLVSFAFVA